MSELTVRRIPLQSGEAGPGVAAAAVTDAPQRSVDAAGGAAREHTATVSANVDGCTALPLTVAADTRRPLSLQAPAAVGVGRGASGPVVVAHRGGALEVPENTLTAFRHSVQAGADWQELDVTLTRDGKLIVIHDDTLERTTDGAGPVESQTLEQLRRLNAGDPAWPAGMPESLAALGVTTPTFGDRYSGERLPTLAEALAIPRARVMVEMKRSSRPDALADATVDAVRAANMRDRVLLSSFEVGLLERAHARDPNIPLLGLVGDEQGIEAMLRMPIAVLAVSNHIAEQALRAAPENIAVWVWTVYTPAQAERLSELGVDGIITDAPTAIIPAVRHK